MHETSNAPRSAHILGFRSAIVLAFVSIVFSLLMGVDMLTGTFSYTSFPTAHRLILPMFFSFCIPFALLILTACVHVGTSRERSIFSLISTAFASASVAVDATVFYTQLTVVLPHQTAGVSAFVFAPGSFQYATEFFGCTLISVSALFLSFVFTWNGIEGWAKFFLLATGILALPIALSVSFPVLWFTVVPLWAITLPGAALMLAVYFSKQIRS